MNMAMRNIPLMDETGPMFDKILGRKQGEEITTNTFSYVKAGKLPPIDNNGTFGTQPRHDGPNTIRIFDHTGEAAARINGMKELLKAAARRKKLVTGKNGVPEYVVNFNWLVDSVNDAERRQNR